MPVWKVEDPYGRYKVWARRWSKSSRRKSLDYRLVEDTTSTKDLVMEIQSGLCETLGDCKWNL